MRAFLSSGIRSSTVGTIRCSQAICRKFSVVAATEPAATTGAATGGNKPEYTSLAAEWYTIGGFSRFASRKDLDMALGDLQPLKVDPILDVQLYASGRWAVLLSVPNLHILRGLLAKTNPKATCTVLHKDEFAKLKMASACGITNCSVRFRNVPSEVGVEELRYFLQEFKLEEGPNDIMPFHQERSGKAFNHFIVKFANPEEAERVVLEKCYTMIEGTPVQMFWYNC
jgi:hypothetical protein